MRACGHPPTELRLADDSELQELRPETSTAHQHPVFFGTLHGESAVVKVFNAGDVDNGRREAALLARFATVSIPVPDVLWSGDAICSLCRKHLWVLVTQRLRGTSLEEIVRKTVFPAHLGRSVIGLMSRQFLLFEGSSGQGYLRRRYEKFEEQYGQCLRQELGVPECVFQDLSCAAASFEDPESLCLITFDWRLRHVFMDGDEVTGIIDLEYGKAGDPILEISNFLHDVRVVGGEVNANYVRNEMESVMNARWKRRSLRSLYRFYGARQALSHAAIRHKMQDAPSVSIERELQLGLRYVTLLANRHRPLSK